MSKAKFGLSVLALAFTLGLPVAVTTAPTPAKAECLPGERIDSSTAEQAKKKFAAFGLRNIRELHKGCDNYWHSIATAHDGKTGRYVLSPQGEIVPEGD